MNKIRKIRKEKNISVEEIMKHLGINTFATYYRKETGIIKYSLDEAKLLSDLFEMSIEELFFDSGFTKNENNETA